MKKIIAILIIVFTLNSCNVNDDQTNYRYEVLPVESFTVPTSFTLGETYEIKVKYKRPTDCYFFEGFYYEKDLNIRTIGVQTSVIEKNDCTVFNGDPIEVSFNFYVTSNGSYIFKFYKGEDANGANIFEEVEIPVN